VPLRVFIVAPFGKPPRERRGRRAIIPIPNLRAKWPARLSFHLEYSVGVFLFGSPAAQTPIGDPRHTPLGQYPGLCQNPPLPCDAACDLTHPGSTASVPPLTVAQGRSSVPIIRERASKAPANTGACWQSRSVWISHAQAAMTTYKQEVRGSSPRPPTSSAPLACGHLVLGEGEHEALPGRFSGSLPSRASRREEPRRRHAAACATAKGDRRRQCPGSRGPA
jgi:hypothetical protein